MGKNKEKNINEIMIEEGLNTVKPKLQKEWKEFVNSNDHKNTDVQYTSICLELLKVSHCNYNELSDFLHSLKQDMKTIEVAYPIVRASYFSVYGEDLKQECFDLYGNVSSKEELEEVITEIEARRKRRGRRRK